MNVSAAGAVQASAVRPVASSGSQAVGGKERTTRAVAELLGMQPRAMQAALARGATMTQLAADAGVSQGDLVATISGALGVQGTTAPAATGSARAGRSTASSGVADVSAPGATSWMGQGVDGLSSALGISSQELTSRLQTGTGIRDLLKTHPEVSLTLARTGNRGALLDTLA